MSDVLMRAHNSILLKESRHGNHSVTDLERLQYRPLRTAAAAKTGKSDGFAASEFSVRQREA
jgi:hypothetical protein